MSSSNPESTAPSPAKRRRIVAVIGGGVLLLAGGLFAMTRYESYASLYDAQYVGSDTCGECHVDIHEQWADSPHAKMIRTPSPESVVGDFENGVYLLPVEHRTKPGDERPAARMYHEAGAYYMALRRPGTDEYVPFEIEYVVGYQYRQTYVTREPGGVLRRLPLQWSVARDTFFPYWNFQEHSAESVEDLWAQTRSMNSAWNLFCARCHVTNLDVIDKDAAHRRAATQWTEVAIGCEACHGPGSHHANYFSGNYVNRFAAFGNSKFRDQPVAYIASAPKLTKGQDLSVCARCHGPDIMMASTDAYRSYEPGYSQEGRINDLSPYFKEFPLQPGRRDPTVECWDDGRPKGIGMLFRSFIESACYDAAEVRCYDCHDPHANKQPTTEGILHASDVSNAYCLNCHEDLSDGVAGHSHHTAGTPGSFCYDCHMPRNIQNLVGGYERFTRTHTMSSIPRPEATIQHGAAGAPNACNQCHQDKSAQWAYDWTRTWWGGSDDPSKSSGRPPVADVP